LRVSARNRDGVNTPVVLIEQDAVHVDQGNPCVRRWTLSRSDDRRRHLARVDRRGKLHIHRGSNRGIGHNSGVALERRRNRQYVAAAGKPEAPQTHEQPAESLKAPPHFVGGAFFRHRTSSLTIVARKARLHGMHLLSAGSSANLAIELR
jgi:hypothetical protein